MLRAMASPISYVAPVAGGTDGTAAIQAALTRGGLVLLPPATQANPILISATLSIPSNTTLKGAGRGLTWIKQVDGASLQPMIQNTNAGGAGGVNLDTAIRLSDMSIDCNGANQLTTNGIRGVQFIGVSNIVVSDLEIKNSRAAALILNGNSVPDGTDSSPSFVDNIFINGVVGSGSVPSNSGIAIQNRQRNVTVSNCIIRNTAGYGLLLDASEGTYDNIQVTGAGFGTSLASAGAVDNPGGAGQFTFAPNPAGIYVRNVTNVVCSNLTATQGLYHGIIIGGARHCSFSGLLATQNSLHATGVYDDIHLDLNTQIGYGENHGLTILGAKVGANQQTRTGFTNSLNPPTSRYGLFIADGLAGSFGDGTIVSGGSSTYAVGDTLTAVGGTSSEVLKLGVLTVVAGVITSLQTLTANGSGIYTVLPANPVSLSGGGGSGATINIEWSNAWITGVLIGQCVTAKTRTPTYITNWTVQTSAGNFGP